MSWSPFFSNVEIEGSSDPYERYGGRGVDAVVGSGRMEISGDSLSGEEISDLDYRALVLKSALQRARSQGRSSPNTLDMALAQKSVDQNLRKRDISRAYRF
jgi:hypothetical protein